MTPTDQTILHDPANGVHGNCMSAVLASLLHLPIDQVPLFTDPKAWQHNLNAWLRPMGLAYIDIGGFARHAAATGIRGCWHEACGPSPRHVDTLHAVVARDGVPVFDPHPSKAGLVDVDTGGVFIALRPWEWGGFEDMRAQMLEVLNDSLQAPDVPGARVAPEWHAGFKNCLKVLHTVVSVMQPKAGATVTEGLRRRATALQGQREVLLDLLRGAAALMETGLFETAEAAGNEAAYRHLRDMQRAIKDLDALRARGE